MIGQAAYGYQINLALLIRPILMTLGMIVGVAIYSVMSGVASNGLWGYAAPILGADGISAPIGLVVMLITSVTFQVALAYFSFNTIFTISDNVPKWLGLNPGTHYNPAEAISRVQGIMTTAGMQQSVGAGAAAFQGGIQELQKQKAKAAAGAKEENDRKAGYMEQAQHIAAALRPPENKSGGGEMPGGTPMPTKTKGNAD